MDKNIIIDEFDKLVFYQYPVRVVRKDLIRSVGNRTFIEAFFYIFLKPRSMGKSWLTPVDSASVAVSKEMLQQEVMYGMRYLFGDCKLKQ